MTRTFTPTPNTPAALPDDDDAILRKNRSIMPILGYNVGVEFEAPPPAHQPVKEAGMRPISLSEKDIKRFWAKVDKSGPIPQHAPELGPCWVWTAARLTSGHGNFCVNGVMLLSHRISWSLANGRDPGDLIIRHRCDNPPCINPGHLLTGSMKDNVADMHERGRAAQPPRGEGHPLAKLTEADVRMIRDELAAGTRYGVLAVRFHVLESTISEIARRNIWAHLQDSHGQIAAGKARGEACGQAKLTEKDVIRIREMAAVGTTFLALAARFGVSRSNIRDIVHRKNWKHVGGPDFVAPVGRSGYVRLTESDVVSIREAASRGESQSAIGERFGIAQAHVSAVVLRKAWRNVP